MVWILLKPELKRYFKNCQKLVILTIGNQLKGDDGLGSYIAEILSPSLFRKDKVVLMDGGTVPENFTGAIKREQPTHLLLIDAVIMDKEPGKVEIIQKERIENYNLSTHAMPLSFLIKYIEHTSPSKVILVGIQPKTMEFGADLSREVKKAADEFAENFLEILKEEKLLN